MLPVGVRVHDVQVGHQVRRRSRHDGSDDGHFDAHLFLQEPLHPGPVFPFGFPKEADPVLASAGGQRTGIRRPSAADVALLQRFAFAEPDAPARLEGERAKAELGAFAGSCR